MDPNDNEYVGSAISLLNSDVFIRVEDTDTTTITEFQPVDSMCWLDVLSRCAGELIDFVEISARE